MSAVIHVGDCREVLAGMADGSANCCVTSPPYFGLRDYGTARWEGGDPACEHIERSARNDGGRVNVGSFNGSAKADSNKGAMNFRSVCGNCGARRTDSQIGLEPTPDEFVAEMVAVFREVRRVLRDDGTLWLNLGDSYTGNASSGGAGKSTAYTGKRILPDKITPGLKPKDLIGIPWRVAFALQADGWYLRSDIIWHKPNPMPESVTDRPTSAHEHVFLFAKSSRYFYDADAVKEEASEASLARIAQPNFANQTGGPKDYKHGTNPNRSMRTTLENFAANPGRNLRNVWTVATQPYSGAHFATFPPALIEPCIKAGCPVGGTVLDPFFGAGTTGLVADRLGRNCIGIELNPEYADLARVRLQKDGGMFAEVAVNDNTSQRVAVAA